MKLIIYASNTNRDHSLALVRALTGFVARKDIEKQVIITDLINDLDSDTWGSPVIIYTRQDDDLDQLLEYARQLLNYRVVLVLHDDKMTTLAKGHKLRPRVLFSQPVDPATIAAVIIRIWAGVAKKADKLSQVCQF
ncbi:MAG: hypothetical protein A2511_17030 [Deltaproteobacteria bacterium RIFOXYD12_FULL_50_9]|nr:MAG: hypothetical protein A2511_17030 [Deltaproteobacteria bacterium RIFOXYD12_FULL_50_9]